MRWININEKLAACQEDIRFYNFKIFPKTVPVSVMPELVFRFVFSPEFGYSAALPASVVRTDVSETAS
jgi:hypothetical protein